ncbi:MAG: hypothetical protein R3A52_13530 [Polyangiales bacterium]
MRRALLAASALCLAACGAPADDSADASVDVDPCADLSDVATRPDGRVVGGPFAARVVSFTPGVGASFGHDRMPDVVLGPPSGAGDLRGGTDVVALGRGGEVVVGFDVEIVDGPGDDFVVFENPFIVPGAALSYWDELGEVSVSEDGQRWVTFRGDPSAGRPFAGCAGGQPVYSAPGGTCPLDPRVSGGDAFDLATVGVARARFVRVRDLATRPLMPPSSGFDLDAVAVLHGR